MSIIAVMEIQMIIEGVLAAAVLLQLIYFVFVYSKLAFHKEQEGSFEEAVSVVICGYNEAENWRKYLPLLLEQDYPNFEIVAVNDQSIDDTEFALKEWSHHPRLKVVNIDHHVKKGLGKKFALTLGIKAAQYDYLLLTDADCYPADEHWIRSMVQHFSSQKQIVLGYGAHEKRGGLLNRLIRFDTFQVALQYLSYALVGKTYMGVGRNLAYKKSLFFDNKGFASHLHIPSGDDDLFIREVATSKNTAIAISPSAHTMSEPKLSWSAWFRQKTRHYSTASYYSFFHQLFLSLWGASQLLFWLTAIYLLTQATHTEFLYMLIGVRLLVMGAFYYPVMRKLGEKDLLWLFPLWELLLLFFQFIFLFSNLLKKKKKW